MCTNSYFVLWCPEMYAVFRTDKCVLIIKVSSFQGVLIRGSTVLHMLFLQGQWFVSGR